MKPIVVFLCISFTIATGGINAMVSDTCTEHDLCDSAILITGIVTDSSMVTISGCNINALPEQDVQICGADTSPTVWYKIVTDERATLLNLRLLSAELLRARLQVFHAENKCDSLEAVGPCRAAFQRRLIVSGIPVIPLDTYYIAVMSDVQTGGTFELSVSTNSLELLCNVDADIDIVSRSIGMELTDPLLPGEQVGVCMRILDWQTFFYGCQWLQGVIPAFGPAWSPFSFDHAGQPHNATINGLPMGDTVNGNYGARWDWHSDVEYHGSTSLLQVGDQDGNGTIELCHTLFEDCQDYGGMEGGCCVPCYNTAPSDVLPPGWFAQGVNGSCNLTGHPNVEWGDGSSCYESDGPWHFCFDLQVAAFPECLQYPADAGLNIKLSTTSDGSTGGTTGDPLSCLYDKPEIIYPAMHCGTSILELPAEILSPVCGIDTIAYLLFHEDVSHWYYYVDPVHAVEDPYRDVPNGTLIQDVFENSSGEPLLITYHFRGVVDSADAYIIKTVFVLVAPAIQLDMASMLTICQYEMSTIEIEPIVSGGTGGIQYTWLPTGWMSPVLELSPPFAEEIHTLQLTDEAGCVRYGEVVVEIDENCFQDPQGEDEYYESNDDTGPPFLQPAPENPFAPIVIRNDGIISIVPNPAVGFIFINMKQGNVENVQVSVLDLQGIEVMANLKKGISDNWLTLDISDLPAGVYMVALHTGNDVLTGRFSKI